jgi:predicted site-specific integrase-resolvase
MDEFCKCEKLLTSAETAEILNVSSKTLNRLTKQGLIMCHTYDRRKFFSYDQISAFMIEMLNLPIVRYREDLQA